MDREREWGNVARGRVAWALGTREMGGVIQKAKFKTGGSDQRVLNGKEAEELARLLVAWGNVGVFSFSGPWVFTVSHELVHFSCWVNGWGRCNNNSSMFLS